MKKLILSLLFITNSFFAGKVDISGLDKKVLLRGLFEKAKTQGMGRLHYVENDQLSDEEVEGILKSGGYVDYLHGRVMKVKISDETLDTTWYNRDNGVDAAEKVIEMMRNN